MGTCAYVGRQVPNANHGVAGLLLEACKFVADCTCLGTAFLASIILAACWEIGGGRARNSKILDKMDDK